jgi:hypothetical protein
MYLAAVDVGVRDVGAALDTLAGRADLPVRTDDASLAAMPACSTGARANLGVTPCRRLIRLCERFAVCSARLPLSTV